MRGEKNDPSWLPEAEQNDFVCHSFDPDEQRALAAINGGGGGGGGRLSRFASGVLALVIAATAISGGLRAIVWMWWQ